MMLKIIFDTNIFYSALGWDGKILDLLYDQFLSSKSVIYTSKDILSEIKEKLQGQKFAQLTTNKINLTMINEFIDLIELNSIIVTPNISLNICRDPKDNKFLELAKTIQADYLISGDKDLLKLKEFEGTKILKPSEFVEIVKNL